MVRSHRSVLHWPSTKGLLAKDLHLNSFLIKTTLSDREQMPSEPIATRIFIVSGPAIYRDALRLLLEAEPGFRVVGAAPDCAQAFQPARKIRPDVLLVDLATPLRSGSSALSALANGCAPARIILLVPSVDKEELLEALRTGVHGVLMKDVSSNVLFRSVRAVAAGQYSIGPETVAELVQGLAEMARPGTTMPLRRNFGLSTRELDIVAALAAGCVNKEIAKRFAISEKTVKHHLTHIFDKLGLSNRLEVALFALHHGLVLEDPASPPGDDPESRRTARPSKSSRP